MIFRMIEVFESGMTGLFWSVGIDFIYLWCRSTFVESHTTSEVHDHYLGHEIHNELIEQIARAAITEIIKSVQNTKSFSVMLDCMHDAGHDEQLSCIIRYDDFGWPTVQI